MQVIRTIIWVALTIVLVAFIAINWVTVPVNFWPLETGYLHFEWPVGFVALIAWLIGFVPMWLFARAAKWRADRRIASLENSLRAATVSTPIATTTQLEAASPPAPAPNPTPAPPPEEPTV